MYNRYIRNDQGSYTRIPEEEASPVTPPPGPSPEGERAAPPGGGFGGPGGPEGPPPLGGLFGGLGGDGSLRKLLDRFHLDRIDSGDLLLLGLLYLLYREGADEELLFALGLLLIL